MCLAHFYFHHQPRAGLTPSSWSHGGWCQWTTWRPWCHVLHRIKSTHVRSCTPFMVMNVSIFPALMAISCKGDSSVILAAYFRSCVILVAYLRHTVLVFKGTKEPCSMHSYVHLSINWPWHFYAIHNLSEISLYDQYRPYEICPGLKSSQIELNVYWVLKKHSPWKNASYVTH